MTPCLEILSLHWWLSISCYQTFYFLQLLLTTTTRPLPHHLRSSFHAIHQLFQRITSSAASEPGHRHRHRPPSSKGILNSSCWHTQTGTGTTESPTSKREDPVPASSCRPGTTGGCVGEPPVPASLLLKAARLAIQHLFFAFFVCIFVSLKFVYLCFMNQPLTSYASGLDGCQCTRTRPTLLLFPFLGSQLSLTRISRPVFFLLLFLNIVASRTCFTCFFCCYMSNWEPKLAESAVSALE